VDSSGEWFHRWNKDRKDLWLPHAVFSIPIR
jgi:hypothetical protein